MIKTNLITMWIVGYSVAILGGVIAIFAPGTAGLIVGLLVLSLGMLFPFLCNFAESRGWIAGRRRDLDRS